MAILWIVGFVLFATGFIATGQLYLRYGDPEPRKKVATATLLAAMACFIIYANQE